MFQDYWPLSGAGLAQDSETPWAGLSAITGIFSPRYFFIPRPPGPWAGLSAITGVLFPQYVIISKKILQTPWALGWPLCRHRCKQHPKLKLNPGA
jgi:hypothetical protein